jgi:threonine aldolase
MLQAMVQAKVGDDVLGDDPTVKELEAMAAVITGKAAALYFPSGTMANSAAVKSWTGEGNGVIVGKKSHLNIVEVRHLAVVSRVVPFLIQTDHGNMDPDRVEEYLLQFSFGGLRIALVALENSHNHWGGCVVPLSNVEEVSETAHRHGAHVHLDGARIFNASRASGVPVRDYAEHVDSLMFCLSKGLGAPVGSMLAGPADFIGRARDVRTVLGGGMRQSGILAAAGIYALTRHVERLDEDHRRARVLAEGLSDLPGLDLDLDRVATNMVVFRLDRARIGAQEYVAAMAERGVLGYDIEPGLIRLVTHLDVDDDDVRRAVDVSRDILKG